MYTGFQCQASLTNFFEIQRGCRRRRRTMRKILRRPPGTPPELELKGSPRDVGGCPSRPAQRHRKCALSPRRGTWPTLAESHHQEPTCTKVKWAFFIIWDLWPYCRKVPLALTKNFFPNTENYFCFLTKKVLTLNHARCNKMQQIYTTLLHLVALSKELKRKKNGLPK